MSHRREEKKTPLVLLHGWGLNRGIWEVQPPLIEGLSSQFELHVLDLPGYGRDVDYQGGHQLPTIAERLLRQAPAKAIWVAWSLGATVAMQAALLDAERFLGLHLISPTPRFMIGEEWDCGMATEPLEELKAAFQMSYEQGLKRFLMLQTNQRTIVKESLAAIGKLPPPRSDSLDLSLQLLVDTDLRAELLRLATPVQIVAGAADRIVAPQASERMYEILSQRSTYRTGMTVLAGGHLCFLENAIEFVEAFQTAWGCSR